MSISSDGVAARLRSERMTLSSLMDITWVSLSDSVAGWIALGAQPAGLLLRAHHREVRALRIARLHDPGAAGHFHRPVQHLAAACLGALGRLRDAVDRDVVVPARGRHLLAGLHHAAAWRLAGCEDLVGAHRAHVDRLVLGP